MMRIMMQRSDAVWDPVAMMSERPHNCGSKTCDLLWQRGKFGLYGTDGRFCIAGIGRKVSCSWLVALLMLVIYCTGMCSDDIQAPNTTTMTQSPTSLTTA